jgi:hypothetical protein
MLTRKNLLWLTGILAVLIVIATAQKTSHERWTSRASSEVLVAGQFERSDLARLEIGHGQDPAAVALVDGPDGWTLASAWGARASTQRLDTLLQSLGNLRGEFRADNPEVLGDFGFSDTTTVSIRGVGPSGGELFHLEVGGRPEMGTGNFVKLPGSSAVYLTSQGLLGNLGLWSGPGRPTSRHFLELQALRLDREAVDAIRLEGETSLELTKDHVMIEPAPEDTVLTEAFADRSQWEWRLDGGQLAVKTKADAVLGAVSNLRAQDVADPTAPLSAYGLEQPARQAIIVLADGSETVLSIGSKREAAGDTPGGYYARVGEAPTIWVIGEFNVDNIFKTRQDLLPES